MEASREGCGWKAARRRCGGDDNILGLFFSGRGMRKYRCLLQVNMLMWCGGKGLVGSHARYKSPLVAPPCPGCCQREGEGAAGRWIAKQSIAPQPHEHCSTNTASRTLLHEHCSTKLTKPTNPSPHYCHYSSARRG